MGGGGRGEGGERRRGRRRREERRGGGARDSAPGVGGHSRRRVGPQPGRLAASHKTQGVPARRVAHDGQQRRATIGARIQPSSGQRREGQAGPEGGRGIACLRCRSPRASSAGAIEPETQETHAGCRKKLPIARLGGGGEEEGVGLARARARAGARPLSSHGPLRGQGETRFPQEPWAAPLGPVGSLARRLANAFISECRVVAGDPCRFWHKIG